MTRAQWRNPAFRAKYHLKRRPMLLLKYQEESASSTLGVYAVGRATYKHNGKVAFV